jgi:S-adenosylmethionine/arginine decarboxylase-like enzyme
MSSMRFRRRMAFHQQPVRYSVDLRGCTAISRCSRGAVTTIFVAALESAGATGAQALSHNIHGGGLTCVLILTESHARPCTGGGITKDDLVRRGR